MRGGGMAQVLQNIWEELEAVSEVGEIMGSMEGEGWVTAVTGMRQELTRNQVSLRPQPVEHIVIALDIMHG